MLTVDFRGFPVRAGTRLLDLGCGAGRHAFEAPAAAPPWWRWTPTAASSRR